MRTKQLIPAGVLALAFCISSIVPPSLFPVVVNASRSETQSSGPDGGQVALQEGKTWLAQSKPSLALAPLEDALKIFTQLGDQNGIGAACDALGDLYQREGQYASAGSYYRRAHLAFLSIKEQGNADLVLNKLGETYLLMKRPEDAKAAFAQFGSQSGTTGSDLASTLTRFANASCTSAPGNVSNPADPPFQGHGPLGPNHVARMDLRITDENGKPVRDASVQLVSTRSPGVPPDVTCDCEGKSNAQGRYLAPPIHVGGDVHLTISAGGFQTFDGLLNQDLLAQPVRALLQHEKSGGTSRILTSTKSLEAPNPYVACRDFYAEFFGYARSKLGKGRAEYFSGQLDAAATDFAGLLAATLLPQAANFKETRRFHAAAVTSLGDIAFRKGDLVAARRQYNEAIEFARHEGRLDLSWAAQAGLGKTLWAMAPAVSRIGIKRDRLADHAVGPQPTPSLRDDSLNAYRDALRDIEAIIEGSMRGDDARTTFLANTHQVFVDAASAMAESALAPATAANGNSPALIAEGFKVTEESRARSLLDLLSESGAEITEGLSPDLVKRRSQNLMLQQQITQQLTGIKLAGQAPKQPVSVLETDLDNLTNEFAAIDNQIRTTSPRYASMVRTKPLTLREVQAQVLDEQTTLLEYCLGDQVSYLWVATTADVHLFKLPGRAQVDKLAMDFRAQLIPPKLQRRIAGVDVAAEQQRGLGISQGPAENVPAFAAASNALYQTAIGPASALLRNQRLLVVADGALNYVPFEALVKTKAGRDYGSLDYLVKTNQVVYAPSASVIAAIRQRRSAVAGKDLLVIADPIFSPSDSRLSGSKPAPQANGETRSLGLGLGSAVNDVAGQNGSGIQLARLGGTRTEAEGIARTAQAGGRRADLWMDLNASEDSVRSRDVSNYRVVHIATHGLLDAERPQFSGVVLSLVGNKTSDGFLRTDEIFNLKLGSPLVMLSACETGLGKERRGEGVIGLSRAFMYAGAPTVGVSLWSIADKSTAELMTDFYQRLLEPAATRSSSVALRDAQLSMISGKKYSAPFYWAPFVLIGEWR